MDNQENNNLVTIRLEEFTQYFVDEFDSKIELYRKILEDKSNPATGGAIGSAISGSKPAISGGVSFATGIPFLGPAIAGVYELGGKKVASAVEERTNKKEGTSLYSVIYGFKGKENQQKLRKILIEACYEIFYAFEQQFMNLTVKNGGETRAMYKLAKDSVNRILDYYINNQEEITVDNFTKAIIYAEKSTMEKVAAKLIKSSRTVLYKNDDKLEKWNTTDLFTKTGLQISGEPCKYYILKETDAKKFGFRRPFPGESKKLGTLLQNFSEINENEQKLIEYSYFLQIEDKSKHVNEIYNILYRRDPNKMEERLKETFQSIKKDILKSIENNMPNTDINCIHDFNELKIFIENKENEMVTEILKQHNNIKDLFKEAKEDREEKFTVTVNLMTEQTNILQDVNLEIKETLGKVNEIHTRVMTQICIPIEFQLPRTTTPFIGRVTELSEIKWTHLDKNMVVISGAKGVGKSELATKYAQEFKHDPSNIIWIHSESHDSLLTSFKDLAVLIGNTLEGKTMTAIVRETISYFFQRKTLFVFDNSEQDNVIVNNLQSFITDKEFISVIITSPSSDWNNNFKVINLNAFTLENAIEYIKIILLKKLNNKFEINDGDCQNLAEFHECLPLALNNATDFIIRQNIMLGKESYTISDYINQFSKKELIVAPPPEPTPPNDTDNDIEKKLLEKLERETHRIGDQISAEAARAEQRVTKFFKREVAGFFKKL